MEPVGITDMKTWSSIDIFLFSNGQQYSPPRKYHLRSEELQWWGTTMSYLGRTHYGSGVLSQKPTSSFGQLEIVNGHSCQIFGIYLRPHTSIELYAIDGTKITSPLELINGAAYVAVEPPDTFTNTGYEEYLLKASRSWEKRLAQKSYNAETTSPDLKGSKDTSLWRNMEDINLPENIADTVSLTVENKSITSSKNPPATKTNQRLQRKSIASSKQNQKKKSFDMTSAVLKRNCTNTDKTFPCPKRKSLKKNECFNQNLLSPIVTGKPNETTNQEKHCSIKPKQNSETEDSENVNVYDTNPCKNSPIIDLFSKEENDLLSLKCNLNNFSIIDNSILPEQKNLTIENVSMLNRNNTEIGNNKDLETNSLIKLNENEKDEYEHNDKLPTKDFQEKEIEKGAQDNIPILDNCNKSKSHDDDNVLNDNSEKQVIDEYVAQMNKGGLLLLKLKIKLKDCKTIVNRDKSKSIAMTTPLPNLLETEKTSQVDINISFSGELLKSNDQQYTHNNSLQSLLHKLYTEETDHITSKNPKIIILQCACRDYSNNSKCCTCDTLNLSEVRDNKLEVISPQQPKETFTGCNCDNDSYKATEYPLKNDLVTQSAFNPNEHRPSLSKGNGMRVKDLTQKFESSDKIAPKEMKKLNNKRISNNILTNDNHRQSIVSTKINEPSVLESDNRNAEYNNDTSLKSICNKSTQTDWCNVLLEARRHEDYTYTFHLPSLYIVKQCNI